MDRNYVFLIIYHFIIGRSPRGGVDRNHTACRVRCLRQVAPHAGAWIEINSNHPCAPSASSRSPRGGVDRNQRISTALSAIGVAPHAGAWIEIMLAQNLLNNLPRRSPRGGVDRNPLPRNKERGPARRSPRGGVDRNTDTVFAAPMNLDVAPHAGAWIEIRFPLFASFVVSVAPHAGAWIEML